MDDDPADVADVGAEAAAPPEEPVDEPCERVVDEEWGSRAGAHPPDLRLVLRTSLGDLVFAANVDEAPRAVTAFTEVAAQGFFERTAFHRLVPGFVLQGGCPRGDGSGDAGAGFDGECPETPFYPRGALALAGRSERASHSTQFFVVLEDLHELPQDYPLLGRLVEGHAILDQLAEWDVDGDERPSPPITLESVAAVT